MILKLHRVRSLRNRGTATPLSPVWARWLVLTVALLFGAVSTAQAAHVHPPARAGHHLQGPLAGSPNADTEEHCPLCVAVHAALPAPMPVAPVPVLVDEPASRIAAARAGTDAWHFARFGRPPPPPLFA